MNGSPSTQSLWRASVLRMSRLEAGLFTNCLDQAMVGPDPFILKDPHLTEGIVIALGQHRSFWLAFGFHILVRQSNGPNMFLRFQAQAERLYRRAIDDFDRLKGLRAEMPNEPQNEPSNEPLATPQPQETKAPPPPEPENPEAPAAPRPAASAPTSSPKTADPAAASQKSASPRHKIGRA